MTLEVIIKCKRHLTGRYAAHVRPNPAKRNFTYPQDVICHTEGGVNEA